VQSTQRIPIEEGRLGSGNKTVGKTVLLSRMKFKREKEMLKFLGRNNTRKKEVKSHWPNWARRLFQTLEEIPWVSLTAISTLFGVMILFLYFRSIDYFPNDFSALIGLGAATSIGAILVIAALSFILIAPAAFYRHYASTDYSPDVRVSFKESELIALQLGGMGGFFAHIAYGIYRDCDEFSWGYALTGAALFLIGFIAAVRITLRKGSFKSRRLRVWASLTLMVFGLAPVFILIPLGDLFSAYEVDFGILLFALWALAIIGNAKGGANLKMSGIAITSVFLVVFIFVLFPITTDRPGFFPTMVAQQLGVRSAGEVKLHVSKKSCELIAALQRKSQVKKTGDCLDDEWNEVSAVVLSNIGERWLLELNSHQSDSKSRLRALIPRADVQALIPVKNESAGKMICSAKRSSTA
jgi:hypothetical protein